MSDRTPANVRPSFTRRLHWLAVGCALLAAVVETRADVSLPKILGDNMVLQREQHVPVWGTAAPDEEVTVRFAGQEKKTRATADGRWEVALEPLKASAEPREFVVAGKNTVTLKNILVGEVWLCAGQSNMEYAVGRPAAGAPAAISNDPVLAKEIETEKYPLIRLFRVTKQTRTPDLETDGWTDCAGDALAAFSAAGFSFGREIQKALGVPVGLIGSYWGGSRIEQWTPPEAYKLTPTFAVETAAENFQIDGTRPGQYVPSMIAPLARFTLRGVLWYQGESNIIATNDGARYADKFDTHVAQWRAWQHNPRLPFIAVQLAPFRYSGRRDANPHTVEELPKLWEAQALALRIRHTFLVPTTDLDTDFGNIHPKGKRVLGQRLADAALAQVYGVADREGTGPLFAKLEIKGTEAIVHFNTPGGGLKAREGQPLAEFEIAGADGQFVPATAVVRSETVVVTSPAVPAPTAVRMGWRETAQPNLVNAAGLPAHPFRTNGPDWRPATAMNQ